MNKQSGKRQLALYFCIAIFLAGCEPFEASYFEGPIWSDDDHSIVYVVEHGTHYPLVGRRYESERSEIMVTRTQSVADGALVFEEGYETEILPLYYSEQHQIIIYRQSYSSLRTFNLTDNTIQTSELDLRDLTTASLSPDGEWIAVYQNSKFQEPESDTISMVFVRTDDLQQSIVIQSELAAPHVEPPLYHWQGNDSVWVSYGSGYAVFNLSSASVTEQTTGCIEPSTNSSSTNSQGLKVSFSDREEDVLTITQGTPIQFCDF